MDEVTREVGDPVIAPVWLLKDRPEGNEPDTKEKESAFDIMG